MHLHSSLVSNAFVFLSVKLFRMNNKGAVKSQDKEIFGNIGLNAGESEPDTCEIRRSEEL